MIYNSNSIVLRLVWVKKPPGLQKFQIPGCIDMEIQGYLKFCDKQRAFKRLSFHDGFLLVLLTNNITLIARERKHRQNR